MVIKMETWKSILHDYKQRDAFQALLKKVYDDYQTKTIYPQKAHLFEAFRLTEYHDVKVVILGQDPYHQPNQANGLAFSVQKGVKIPPSLNNIFKELTHDLGIEKPAHGDLTAWAKQGVLLLNTILSVEANQPGSHKLYGWQDFTDEVIQQLSRHPTPLVFMLWGNHAASKEKYINANKHLILKASHPSPLAARHSFFGCKHFSKANAFLLENERRPIDFSL